MPGLTLARPGPQGGKMEFVIQSEPTLAEFQHAQSLGRGSRRTIRLLAWINNILVFMAFILVLSISIRYALFSAFTYLILFLAVLYGLVFVLQVFVMPARVRKLFAQYSNLTGAQEITIRDDAYGVRTQFGQAAIPWKQFVQWTQDDRLMVIFQTDNQFYLLPKRLLSSEQILGIANALNGAGVREITPSVPRIVLQAAETALLISINLGLAFTIFLDLLLRVFD
jgi:hypothetical protein